jgi:hypothetical protein
MFCSERSCYFDRCFEFELSEVGGTVLAENYVQTSNVSLTAMALCVKGDYLSTAAGSKTFRLRMKSDSGASTISAPATNTSTIEWTIFQLDAALPSPVLIGSVTSTSTGSDHIERVAVGTKCTGSPCTMDSNTPGITSVTRTGTGNYAINFTAGTFSRFPRVLSQVTFEEQPMAGARVTLRDRLRCSPSIAVFHRPVPFKTTPLRRSAWVPVDAR